MLVLLSCCGLRHRPHAPTAERAPLIPPSDDIPSHPRVIDHQKLKERLGSVVRSKEGKMVNVNAHFPFGLRTPDPSCPSSRNVSGGTLPGSRAASPSPPRQLQKSSSTASLRPDEDALHYLPPAVHPPASVLNVRLVKSARFVQSTRGRSQRVGDPNGRTQALDAELALREQHAPRAHPSALGSEERPHAHLPVSPEAPPYPEDFDIHDAGAVARSWGD